MEKILFIEYPACSTCKKAKKFLDECEINYFDRNIKLNNPNKEELYEFLNKSNIDVNKMFNTSGLLYKELNIKDRKEKMTIDEKIDLLSSNGMLVKRPILVLDDDVLFGFKEEEWKKKINKN